MHWASRKKVKDKFRWLIRGQQKHSIAGTVTVTIVNYAIRLMDWDNLASRFKIVGDALVANKQLEDDSPKVIISFKMEQVRVSKKDEVRLEILIEPID